MENVKKTLTDPAWEIYEIFNAISVSSGKNVSEAVSEAFKCNPYDYLYYTLIGVVSERCESLKIQISKIEELSDHIKEIESALTRMQKIFSSPGAGWVAAKELHLRPEYLMALRIASPLMRKLNPLRRLTHEELYELKNKIEVSINDIVDGGLSGTALHGSLLAILSILDRFQLFGHVFLSEKLTSACVIARKVSQNQSMAARSVLGAIFAVGTALIWTNDLTEALDSWEGRFAPVIEWVVDTSGNYLGNNSPVPLFLPAPDKALEESSNEVGEDSHNVE